MTIDDEKCDLCDKPEDCTDPIDVLCTDCYNKVMKRAFEDIAEQIKDSQTVWH